MTEARAAALEPVRLRWDVALQQEHGSLESGPKAVELPSSFNALGMSSNPFAIKHEVDLWGARLGVLLSGEPETVVTIPKPGTKTKTIDVYVQRWGELPHPCERILVEAEITFPTLQSRDQGNFRVLIEKALGDCLVEHRWLEDDAFYPVSYFEFGNLSARYEKGVKRLDLVLLPMPAAPHPAPAARAKRGKAKAAPAAETFELAL